jgi:serine/threonine protein kinase
LDLTVGQIIGDYEVLAVLGAGGMGKVYKVRSTISQRVEAMKILLPDLSAAPELGERFLREIRISASLDHPHIAALRAAQRVGNQLLMVMEFIDGATLSDLMQKSRMPLDRCLKLISQALSALDYAHTRNVVHRDIKPANIMLTSTGEVKLMDFGIAKLATDSSLTKTGTMVGSVPYMSPEQIEGREIDGRSDIYSLGVTLYEMVTGKRPFKGKSDFEIMTAHLTGVPQPPRELDPTLPGLVNEVILTALAKNPGDRFATAKAMQNAVDSIAASLAQPAAPDGLPTTPLTAKVAASPLADEAKGPVQVLPGARVAAPPRNHRMAYMLAGSLATLAVLIGAVLELPRFFHTKASDRIVVQQPAGVVQEKSVPGPATPSAANPVETYRTPSQPEGSSASQGGQQGNELNPQSATKPPLTAKPLPIRSQAKPRESTLTPAASSTMGAATTATLAAGRASGNSSNLPASPSPGAVSESTQEVAALRDRMMLMNARVSGVRSSLNNLKNTQAQSGLGLRRDMVSSEERLVYQMSEAANRIDANDAAGALKRLDAAETDLEKLENFLGK